MAQEGACEYVAKVTLSVILMMALYPVLDSFKTSSSRPGSVRVPYGNLGFLTCSGLALKKQLAT